MSTLTSPRQQAITIEQVRARIADAERRAADALREELKASTAAAFNEASRALHKAADDLYHWKIVLRALTR